MTAINTGLLRIDGRPLALLVLDRALQSHGQHQKRSTRRARRPFGGNRGAKKRALRQLSNRAVKAQQIIEHAFLVHAGMTWRDVEKELRGDKLLGGFKHIQSLAQRHGLVADQKKEKAA